MKIPRIISGRAAFLGLAFLSGEVAQAESTGRIRMVGPSPSEEVVKMITKSLETACNSRDVIGVLGHYTPQRAAKVRRAVENAFICNDMELDVQEAFLLSATDSEIVFGVRYGWHDKAATGPVFASRVTAKKVGESWLLDAEEVLSRQQPSTESARGPAAVAVRPGGLIPCEQRPDWIPRDIGWRPGGCANGRCGL
jgi:hypothetical protein